MISLSDPRQSNPVLAALKIQLQDRIVAIRENAGADSNFILTHLIKQIFHEKSKLCLVNLHNTIEHYQTVGKKLGYDIFKAEENDEVTIIDPIRSLVEDIGAENCYFQEDKEEIVKCLYFDIKQKLDYLLAQGESQACLVIDDVSHLLDLGIDLTEVISFINYCVDLVNNDRISIVLNNHVGSKRDEIISNNLQYLADVNIEISPLKTGKSIDVTGVMIIERQNQKKTYQFKAYDRGIKTFHPGEVIYNLYQ